jgi:hypothetical protein
MEMFCCINLNFANTVHARVHNNHITMFCVAHVHVLCLYLANAFEGDGNMAGSGN